MTYIITLLYCYIELLLHWSVVPSPYCCIILLVVIGFFFLYICFQRTKNQLRRSKEDVTVEKDISEILFKNINAFILLVKEDFVVVKTNYYTQTHTVDRQETKRVGELLCCKNALDAGECGTHENCQECPVRAAITKAFVEHLDFKEVEATMDIYTAENKEPLSCEIMASGTCLQIREEDHVLLTVYDITHLKQIQRDLIVAKEQAEQADKLKSAFLANMSHELRTPLNAIVGFSELLAMAENQKEKDTYLSIITQNNSLLLQLINDILDMSKIEAGMIDFNYSEVDLNQLLKDLQDVFRNRNKGRNIDISCEVVLDECIICTEKSRLYQIFNNLIANALKFTTKGYVHFGYQIREKDIYFYVKDTGPGISPEDQQKLFNRFVKLNTMQPGTGLGLAICQMLIRRLEGQIGVDSELGKGSTFWFTIPLENLNESSVA